MDFNKNVIKGKWLEFKGNLKKQWGKLTDDELDKTDGDVKAIGGLIQQRYGEKEEVYGRKLEDIYRGLEERKDNVVDNVKDKLRRDTH